MIATTDPVTLPEATTWYLETTLPLATADLAEIVRLYGLRNWVEQAYKHIKHSLGWSQYQVRSDVAMRRHWALVQCAFAFCWWAESRTPTAPPPPDTDQNTARPSGERGEKGDGPPERAAAAPLALLAAGAAAGAGVAGAGVDAVALLDRVERPTATPVAPGAARLAVCRQSTPPL